MSTLSPTRIPSGSRSLARNAQARILFPSLDAIRGVIDARDNLFCEGILLKGFRSRISEERENVMKKRHESRIDNTRRWYVTAGPSNHKLRPPCGWCYHP
jgi:hypothetical protein